uniref:vomeronasal type-2 receptor 26-like n=1 Tax=Myxine glutinosa TaxID=7769 RepID=UPI00358FF41C
MKELSYRPEVDVGLFHTDEKGYMELMAIVNITLLFGAVLPHVPWRDNHSAPGLTQPISITGNGRLDSHPSTFLNTPLNNVFPLAARVQANTESLGSIKTIPKNLLLLFLLILQLSFFLFWIIFGDLSPSRNKASLVGILILECSGASPAWAICGFVQLGLLSSICLALALKARKQPSSFNDPKFITFSMLVFFLLCFCFVPAYSSTRGKINVVTEIFFIISTSYGFLGCMFLPKCYFIFKSKKLLH